MLTRKDKERFVKDAVKAIGSYKIIGIVPLDKVPDRLLQKSRYLLKGDSKVIMGRKTLLVKILESNAQTKPLIKYVEGTSAVVLSNTDDPFELYGKFSGNVLKLRAKPNQLAPDEITIQSGETTLQPGQAVTELKQAGVAVQIQKGKVVISKDMIIKKGDMITPGIAKALHTLNITPFTATITPSVLLSKGILFGRRALGITRANVLNDITRAFDGALKVSMASNILNRYTVTGMIAKAYGNALFLGREYKLYDKGITESLVGDAVLQGRALDNLNAKV